VDHFGGITRFWQVWVRPENTNGWLEIPFHTGQVLDSNLVLKMVHSWSCGVYRVLLDGKQLAQIDFYAGDPTAINDKLGSVHLDAGKHVLRFECVGKSPESMGYALGFGSLIARTVAYSRPADVDLRSLQKH
jgi:hypothetical protein